MFAEHPGVVMIAEESTSWPGVSHPVHHDGLGFSHKWNMGWMHDTLGYFAHDPVHRRWHHRDLTFGLLYAFSERFVLPLSHDEVVHGKGSLLNKMPGDEWRRFANLRALYGWMWAYPGDPMLFMGGEIAQWREWSETKGVDWAALKGERHRGVQELVRALNRVAGEWPALTEQDRVPSGFQWLDADDADHSMYSFLRWSADGREVVACIANMTPVPREGYRVGLPWAGEWQVLLDTNATYFGGTGQGGRTGGVGRRRRAAPGPTRLGVPHRPAARGDLARLSRHVTDVPSGRAVVTASLALGVAVGLVGVSFGVLAVANGLTVPQAMAMSLLVFTGASQFAAVGVLAAGGSGPAAVGSGLLLAARNGVYGLALAPILQGSLGRRLLASQLVIDETTAMATAQPDRPNQVRAFWTSGLAIFVCWNAGTLVGAVAGGALSDPAQLGLDAAFPAGFVVLIGPHLRDPCRPAGRGARRGAGARDDPVPPARHADPGRRPRHPRRAGRAGAGGPVRVDVDDRGPGRAGRRRADRGADRRAGRRARRRAMSWLAILALAGGSYLCKVVGLVVIGGRPLPARLQACLALIPAALLSALIVSNTFTLGQELVIDARVPGVAAAAIAAWRRLPFPVVIAIGAGVTALVPGRGRRLIPSGGEAPGVAPADGGEGKAEATEGPLAGDGRLVPVGHQVEEAGDGAGGAEGEDGTGDCGLVLLDAVAGDGPGQVVERGGEGGARGGRLAHGSTVRTAVDEVQRLIAVMLIT